MTIIAAWPRFASGLFARIGPEMIGGGTGTSHIHPFGVTRREGELARLNASTDVPLRGKGLFMRRLTGSLLLAAAILGAAGLATACGSGISSSISSAIASRSSGQTASSSPAESTSSSAVTSPSSSAASSAATSSSPSVPSVTVTATAPSSSAAPAPAAQPSASATAPANGSGSGLIWLWIVIGLAVVIGATALIVRSARRRSAIAAGWRTKVIDVYAEGSALLDAMRIADARGLVAGDGPADAQWYDIQRRADDLARSLYALREQAPDEESRARVADVLAALQAARAAMDSERASGAASGPGEEMIRSRLATFEASLRTLRSAYYPEG